MPKRREYELAEAQLEKLLDACKPVRCMMVGGYVPRTPQQNANAAWALLGEEMGFLPLTVKPVSGKEQRFFTAEAVEMAESK